MQIVFNATGTHLHKEGLFSRVDLYPKAGDASYKQHYVEVPVTICPKCSQQMLFIEDEETGEQWYRCSNTACGNLELYEPDDLPRIMKLNPCLCAFVRVDEDITKKLLTEFTGDVFSPEVLATIDEIMAASTPEKPHLSAHLISPYMRHKLTLSSRKVTSFDEQAKAFINSKLAGFEIRRGRGEKGEDVKPESIDVGPGASDRATNVAWYTGITMPLGNPANATGILDTFQAWITAGTPDSNIFGTAYGSNPYTSRDYTGDVGSMAAGSLQTFSGLSVDVETGDFIFLKCAENIMFEAATVTATYHRMGTTLPFTDASPVSSETNKEISLYATGTEAGSGLPIIMLNHNHSNGGLL